MVGFSGLYGPNTTGPNGDTWIYGMDMKWRWRPVNNSRGWPFLLWQSEIMQRDFKADRFLDDGNPVEVINLPGRTLHDWGFYSQLLYGFHYGWAVGLRVGWWDTLLSIWLGTVIGFSIHVAGVIYTFASLVLPALIAKNLSQEVRSMFFISPLIASTTGISSFMLANYYDYPPGQMSTAVFCFVLVVAWFVHYVRATRLSN